MTTIPEAFKNTVYYGCLGSGHAATLKTEIDKEDTQRSRETLQNHYGITLEQTCSGTETLLCYTSPKAYTGAKLAESWSLHRDGQLLGTVTLSSDELHHPHWLAETHHPDGESTRYIGYLTFYSAATALLEP